MDKKQHLHLLPTPHSQCSLCKKSVLFAPPFSRAVSVFIHSYILLENILKTQSI